MPTRAGWLARLLGNDGGRLPNPRPSCTRSSLGRVDLVRPNYTDTSIISLLVYRMNTHGDSDSLGSVTCLDTLGTATEIERLCSWGLFG
jgi:hypothetical protein